MWHCVLAAHCLCLLGTKPHCVPLLKQLVAYGLTCLLKSCTNNQLISHSAIVLTAAAAVAVDASMAFPVVQLDILMKYFFH